jgi:type VI secretion system protein ImpJ
MKNLNRVVWTKGMFLTPQHFQMQDRVVEDLIQFRFGASHFANWGVTELRIDIDALANGKFRVERCNGVLPDGLVFEIPDTDEAPDGRPVKEHFPATDTTLDAYLAIPELRPHGNHVTVPPGPGASANSAATRYAAETRLIADEIGGVEEKAVQVARPRFRILYGTESVAGYTTLRIAQIQRNQAGAYVLNTEFVAPCLDVASSDFLTSILRRQVEILSVQASTLAASRRQAGEKRAEFNAAEITDYWLLHTVNMFLPVLQHIWRVRHGHPENLYVTLLQLAGALSTLNLNANSAGFPTYDHNELGACFKQLDETIRELAKTGPSVNCVAVPLAPAGRLVWAGAISNDELLANSQVFLAISSSSTNVETLIREVPHRVKIASPADMPRLIANSLTGLALRHAAKPPSAIHTKYGNEYFGLTQQGLLWDNIRRSRNVNVYVPAEIGDAKMELLIVLGDRG